MMRRRLIIAWLCCLAFVCAGCGDKGPPRYQFSGKVTYQGQPVPAGIMYFDPDITAGDGVQGHATILNGEYDTSKDGGQGFGGGKCLVRVYAHDGVPAPELPMGKLLFPEVVIAIELPKSDGQQDLEIPSQRK
jgi:hypothetical protein